MNKKVFTLISMVLVLSLFILGCGEDKKALEQDFNAWANAVNKSDKEFADNWKKYYNGSLEDLKNNKITKQELIKNFEKCSKMAGEHSNELIDIKMGKVLSNTLPLSSDLQALALQYSTAYSDLQGALDIMVNEFEFGNLEKSTYDDVGKSLKKCNEKHKEFFDELNKKAAEQKIKLNIEK